MKLCICFIKYFKCMFLLVYLHFCSFRVFWRLSDIVELFSFNFLMFADLFLYLYMRFNCLFLDCRLASFFLSSFFWVVFLRLCIIVKVSKIWFVLSFFSLQLLYVFICSYCFFVYLGISLMILSFACRNLLVYMFPFSYEKKLRSSVNYP